MTRTIPSLAVGLLLAGALTAQSLSTPYLGGNGQSGNMFDVVATNTVTICSMDVNLAGTANLEIYTKTGTHVGFEGMPAAWTLVGSAANVVSNGANVPTPAGIPLSITINAGATQAFYVTTTNGTLNYTNGVAVGTVLASDANISILEGVGVPYAFAGIFTPRNWNGTINYGVGAGSCGSTPFEVNEAESSFDVDGAQSTGFAAAITTACVGQTVSVNAATTLVGNGYEIGVDLVPAIPSLFTTPGGQVLNVNIFSPTAFFLNGGAAIAFAPHPGAFTIPVTFGGAITASGLQGVLSPAHADGVAVSQTAQLDVVPNGTLSLNLGDDANVQVITGDSPLCYVAPITFYGTTYTSFFVNSNGDVSFTAGHADFSPTAAEWNSMMPRVGLQGDYEPNLFGTIDVTVAGGAISVNYNGVTEWGTAGLGVTSYSVEFNGTAAPVAIRNFSSTGWATTPTVFGASNGASGTAGAAISMDAAFGLGIQVNALGTDSVFQATAGMVPNTAGWSEFLLPLGDGSAWISQ